jgi:hypothetical protein
LTMISMFFVVAAGFLRDAWRGELFFFFKLKPPSRPIGGGRKPGALECA